MQIYLNWTEIDSLVLELLFHEPYETSEGSDIVPPVQFNRQDTAITRKVEVVFRKIIISQAVYLNQRMNFAVWARELWFVANLFKLIVHQGMAEHQLQLASLKELASFGSQWVVDRIFAL